MLSEKPLVTRVEDAKRVGAAAVRAGRVLHTVHNWLEAPICCKISTLVDEGAIGAVQAQDYAGALWAVGMRTSGATEADVEQAVTARTIVRTWPLRGTSYDFEVNVGRQPLIGSPPGSPCAIAKAVAGSSKYLLRHAATT